MTAAANSYDLVPYPSYAFPQTHPDRLATLATLFGLTPAPVDYCRVLEIGCAGGGNLVPMAASLPNSIFMGIDLSARQIEAGQRWIAELGIRNIELCHADLAELESLPDKFDYVICHGVYSWVAEPIQRRILQLCTTYLNPHGVAYISYNTYPGWHMRGMIRDMMCYHVQGMEDPADRIRQARALLEFLARSVPSENSAYGMLVKSELDLLRQQSDAYLFHEHLEAVNTPIYFFQFVQRLQEYGLKYLGDTQIATMWLGNLPTEVGKTLEKATPNITQQEQYTDFLRNRTFRQSLVCHMEIPIKRDLTPSLLDRLYIAADTSRVASGSTESSTAGSPIEYTSPRTGQRITSTDPLIQSVLDDLGSAWPGAISYRQLWAKGSANITREAVYDASRIELLRQKLGQGLLQLFVKGIIELQTQPSSFVTATSEWPCASPLSRSQARADNRVTNQRHETAVLSDLARHLLPFVDGTRSLSDLLQVALDLIDQGKLVPRDADVDVATGSIIADAVTQTVHYLAKQAVLIS